MCVVSGVCLHKLCALCSVCVGVDVCDVCVGVDVCDVCVEWMCVQEWMCV